MRYEVVVETLLSKFGTGPQPPSPFSVDGEEGIEKVDFSS